MYGICCLYCLLSFYQSILSSQRRSVTSTLSGAESSVKAFFSFCKDNHFFVESFSSFFAEFLSSFFIASFCPISVAFVSAVSAASRAALSVA